MTLWTRFKSYIASLFDDGLNHDWDGEWTEQDLEDAHKHLANVEERFWRAQR